MPNIPYFDCGDIKYSCQFHFDSSRNIFEEHIKRMLYHFYYPSQEVNATHKYDRYLIFITDQFTHSIHGVIKATSCVYYKLNFCYFFFFSFIYVIRSFPLDSFDLIASVFSFYRFIICENVFFSPFYSSSFLFISSRTVKLMKFFRFHLLCSYN